MGQILRMTLQREDRGGIPRRDMTEHNASLPGMGGLDRSLLRLEIPCGAADTLPVILGIPQRCFRRRERLHTRLILPHRSRYLQPWADQQPPDEIGRGRDDQEGAGYGHHLKQAAPDPSRVGKDALFVTGAHCFTEKKGMG